MKAVFCTYDGKNIINGVNTWLLTLLPALQSNGITVKVIAIAWAPENECTTIPLLRDQGIECSIIDSKGYTERQVKWILNYVNREVPDVFIANNMLPAYYASKWIQQAGIPVISVLHNDNPEYEAVLEEFASGKNDFRFSAIVAVSEHLKDKLIPYSKDILIKKIPCGVTVSNSKSTYTLNQLFKIAYVGRLVQEQKNIAAVIKAFCETVTTLPNVEAYVYGSGPDTEIIDQILKEFNYPERLILKGNLPHNQVKKELLEINTIALMSDYEGLPVSLMEAMALGVVPVCTRIKSGVSELVIDGVTGLYIDKPGDYTNKVKWMIQNPDEWEKLSVNAKEHIRKNYAADKCMVDWMSLFNEIKPVKKQTIKIPSKIKLPQYNPNLSNADNREPALWVKGYRKVKRTLSFNA